MDNKKKSRKAPDTDKAVLYLKPLPSSVNTERTLLCTLLNHSEGFTKIESLLEDTSFYDEHNARIYRAMKSLSSEGLCIDHCSVYDKLYSTPEDVKFFEAGCCISEYLRKLRVEFDDQTANLSQLNTYAKILIQKEQARELVKLGLYLSNEENYIDTQGNEESIQECRDRLDKLSAKLDDVSRIIGSPTVAEFQKVQEEVPEGIKTNYIFENDIKEQVPLILPSSSLTFICGATSHGKSTFLRNIAYDIVKDPSQGKVLYFTFEEPTQSLSNQFINLEIGHDLNVYENVGHKLTNIQTIGKYWKNDLFPDKEGRYSKNVETASIDIETAVKRYAEYFCTNKEGQDAKLIIVNKDIPASKLASLVKTYYNRETRNGGKVSAVFIDYIQLLTEATENKNQTKVMELSAVCDRLRSFAIETHLPVICAAQMVRETKSPLDLCNQNISDASAIEKAAHLIVCIWNSKFAARDRAYYGINTSGAYSSNSELGATLRKDKKFYAGGIFAYSHLKEEKIDEFEAGKQKIYAKITKWRGNEVNQSAVFDYIGNVGRIVPNVLSEQPVQDEVKDNNNNYSKYGFL